MLAGEMKTINITQGEFQISNDPNVVLSTVLGSCVSVCLFDDQTGVGGMNHFLLPGTADSNAGDVKYGVHAMELLINGLLKRRAQRNLLVAKVFGAATMSGAHSGIGTSNGEYAIDFLQKEGINVASQSLGGTNARRLKFQPTTGRVQQYLVPFDTAPQPVKPAPKPADDITMF